MTYVFRKQQINTDIRSCAVDNLASVSADRWLIRNDMNDKGMHALITLLGVISGRMCQPVRRKNKEKILVKILDSFFL